MPARTKGEMIEIAVSVLFEKIRALEEKVQKQMEQVDSNLHDLHETARSHADLIDRITSKPGE